MENGDKLMQVKGDELLPGRVLDHQIARHIFGWKDWYFVNPSRIPGDSFEYDALVPPEYGDSNIQTTVNITAPSYSTDLAAAWTVLEKIGLTFELTFLRSTGHYHVRLMDGEVKAAVVADTAPHAICLAALKFYK